MTREHKLALIVGFSLLLVLGVLLSDHLSKARSEVQSQDIRLAASNEVGASTSGLQLVERSAGDDLRQPLPGTSGVGPSAPPTSPLPVSTDANIALPQGSPEVVIETVPDGGFRRSEIPQGLAGKVETLPTGASATLPGTNTPAVPGTTMTMGSVRPLGTTDIPATTPGLPVSQGQMKRHDVQEGEAIFTIARKAYGDGGLWPKLREFNKGKISDTGNVREGVTIMLPPKDVLLGQAVLAPDGRVNPTPLTPAAGGRGESANTKPGASDRRSGGAGYTTYTVKSGDSLQDVAKRLLGSSKRWPEIVEANKMSDPSMLKVGQQLRIPAR